MIFKGDTTFFWIMCQYIWLFSDINQSQNWAPKTVYSEDYGSFIVNVVHLKKPRIVYENVRNSGRDDDVIYFLYC